MALSQAPTESQAVVGNIVTCLSLLHRHGVNQIQTEPTSHGSDLAPKRDGFYALSQPQPPDLGLSLAK
jgi:hypothetical protein